MPLKGRFTNIHYYYYYMSHHKQKTYYKKKYYKIIISRYYESAPSQGILMMKFITRYFAQFFAREHGPNIHLNQFAFLDLKLWCRPDTSRQSQPLRLIFQKNRL